jgi:branched-chain amino acid transport system ATP-binding protein
VSAMLVVDDIHTYYGESYVLQGVSLEVAAGAVTVLMGRNGVGKTTTVRTIMGLTAARKGRVLLEGEDVTRLPTHRIAKRGLGFVPQGRRVFPSLSVREHLGVGGRRENETWTLDRIFDLFPPLLQRIDQKGATLSGGEQSMLAVARALRTEPRCLILDEPTEGLAPIYVDIVLEVILQLKQAGDIGLLAVLPEIPLARAVADTVYVMGKGSVVFSGTKDEFEQRKDVHEQHIGVG